MGKIVEVRSDGHKIEAMDKTLAMRISSLLSKHYPGHMWAVFVSSEQGVVDIKNLYIAHFYGFRLMLKDVQSEQSLKSCVWAGGEMLERAGMPRGAYVEKTTHIDGVREKHQPRPDGLTTL